MSTEYINSLAYNLVMHYGWHKSPLEYTGIDVNNKGELTFRLTKKDKYDYTLGVLFKLLNHIHSYCILLFTDNYKFDAFEISWAVQIHMFISHKKGKKCVSMQNGMSYINKESIIYLAQEAISRTNMTRINAIDAFTMLSNKILEL
jgi:hypothetical protein